MSLTVSDVFVLELFEYPLDFKTLNKIEQASLELCLLLAFL